MKRWLITLVALGAMTVAANGQPRNYRHVTGPFRSEIRLTAAHFDNFYQASNRDLAETMNNGGFEYRAAYRPKGTRTDYYGHANYTWWNGRDLVASYGGRLGIARESDLQDYNVFIQRNENRPSFEVGNTYARADTTVLYGEYSYRVKPDWEVGGEATLERQTYEADARRNNDFRGAGASVRYRGFGDIVSPKVGFFKGTREVQRSEENYKSDDYYLELVTEAIPNTWASLGYHSQGKNYSVRDTLSENFHREESGPEISLTVSYRSRPRVNWTMYYSRNTNESNVANNDFTTNFILFGVSYGF